MIDRVVIINDDCVERGGAAAIALASARLLRGNGLPVTFLSGDSGVNPEFGRLGIDAVSLGGISIAGGARGRAALRGIYDSQTRGGMVRWLAEHDTPGTIYHLHNWHKVLSPSLFGALRPVAARLLISAHDYFLACPNGGYVHYPRHEPCDRVPGSLSCIVASCDRRRYTHKLWRMARHQTRRMLFDLASTPATIVAVHEGMVPHLERGGIAAQAIRVLRNPVTPWRASRVAAERNRDAFFVGRLEADKGVELVAGAARRAGVRLRIVGDGPLAASLARRHPEVELLGWRSRSELAQLAASARMVVAPTRWRETFGLVALEATMSGIPVIASRLALIADELVQLGVGLACDPHDEAALAAAIGELGADDRKAAAYSRRGFAEGRHLAPTAEVWCQNLIALYEDTLIRSQRAGAAPSAAAIVTALRR